jgi:hypothetical protein
LKSAIAMAIANIAPQQQQQTVDNDDNNQQETSIGLQWCGLLARETTRSSSSLEYKRAACNAVRDVLKEVKIDAAQALPW